MTDRTERNMTIERAEDIARDRETATRDEIQGAFWWLDRILHQERVADEAGELGDLPLFMRHRYRAAHHTLLSWRRLIGIGAGRPQPTLHAAE